MKVIIEKGIPLEHTSGRKYLGAQMETSNNQAVGRLNSAGAREMQ